MSIESEINEVYRDRVRRTVTAPEVQAALCQGMIRGLLREQAELSDRLDAVERRLPPMRFRRRWFRKRNRLVRAGGDDDWLGYVGVQRTWAKHDAPSVERPSSEMGVSPIGSTPYRDSESKQHTPAAKRDAGTPDAERENDPGSERNKTRPVNPSCDAELFDLTLGLPLEHQPGPVPGWMWFVAGLAMAGLLLALAVMGGGR